MEQNIRLVLDEQAFVLTCSVDTLYFDDHFNAYRVDERVDPFSVFPIKAKFVTSLIQMWKEVIGLEMKPSNPFQANW